ncbi:hypothetical protein DYB31_010301 [Aphanomyces astaci]|uniref:Peptidase M3A/M3B catalytic domain-containing protein n=1 Tax=Aphanomyces astaci TaxID=112090 RepID=A0A397EZE1_APHAT|nr:hypothetical protein DYB31_010301 [Aphanomyces astaci]
MLQLRHELAQLLGFATFAELSLANKVAPSVDAVLDTLEELRDKALPRSQAELRLLEEFAASHDHPLPLQQWDIPYCLMTFNDLALLFGRVGIGLRIALTSAEYTAASGMEGIEMDALAVPVAMMKRFCYHSIDFIQSISSHYQTHQPLPQTDLDKIVAAKRFMAGTTLTRQLSLAAIDLSVHHHHGTSATITADSTDALVEKIKHEYVWSEVQAHDAYACFEDTQGDLPAWKATGKRFRDTILALSGVLHPTKAFELFRGRKLQTHAMLEQYGLL